MTFAEFRPVFHEAAVAYQHAENTDEARVYFTNLRTFALSHLRDGLAIHIANSAWWPKVSEWRALAAQAQQRAYRESQTRLIAAHEAKHDREVYTVCIDCQDTGWVSQACPERDCGRHFRHPPHNYVVACSCRDTNAVYQRSLLRERARQSHDPSPDEARRIRQRLERDAATWQRVGAGGEAA